MNKTCTVNYKGSCLQHAKKISDVSTKPTIFDQTYYVELKNKFKKFENFPVHLSELTKTNTCTCIESCLQSKQDLRQSKTLEEYGQFNFHRTFFSIAHILKKQGPAESQTRDLRVQTRRR